MKFEFSQHVFEKCSHIRFDEKLISGSRVFACGQAKRRNVGQTDGRDEANSGFSQFCERA